MIRKSQRQAAHEAVVAYHEAQLGNLAEQVGLAVDGFRAGEMDAFELDRVLFQYSRAAKELWKFCNFGQPEDVLALVDSRPSIDWWAAGAPRER